MLSMINKTPSRRSVLQWGLSAAAGTLGASRLLGEEPSTAPAGGWNPMGKHRARDFPCCIPADTRYSGFGEQPIRSR